MCRAVCRGARAHAVVRTHAPLCVAEGRLGFAVRRRARLSTAARGRACVVAARCALPTAVVRWCGPLGSSMRRRVRSHALVRSHATLCAVGGRWALLGAAVRGCTQLYVAPLCLAINEPFCYVECCRARLCAIVRGLAPLYAAMGCSTALNAVVRGYAPSCVGRRHCTLQWTVTDYADICLFLGRVICLST